MTCLDLTLLFRGRSTHKDTQHSQCSDQWLLSIVSILGDSRECLSPFLDFPFREKFRESQGKINGKASLYKFKVNAMEECCSEGDLD